MGSNGPRLPTPFYLQVAAAIAQHRPTRYMTAALLRDLPKSLQNGLGTIVMPTWTR